MDCSHSLEIKMNISLLPKMLVYQILDSLVKQITLFPVKGDGCIEYIQKDLLSYFVIAFLDTMTLLHKLLTSSHVYPSSLVKGKHLKSRNCQKMSQPHLLSQNKINWGRAAMDVCIIVCDCLF